MIEERKDGAVSLHKHIVGLLVEDRAGVLTKVAGLFARRGFNIDTIVVGKTNRAGVSHIVISLFGDDRTLEQVEKQANKLINVIKVIDLNEKHSVVREHCLLKVSAVDAEKRQDIVNYCALHKANALNVDDDSVIIEIVGSPQKIDSFLELMQKFGVKEVSRTGINAMQRNGEK
ncbi:MAG: acetolactate synthase small subunit [Candidatus Diapherotrites archaeon]